MKPFLPDQILPTTVVGSYPALPKRTLSSLFDPFHGAVMTAVAAQKEAGIHIISDGQVRGDMITTFASKLPGVRGNDVIGRVHPPDVPVTIRDTRYAVSCHPYVKGIITGPSTLSHGLRIVTPQYRGRDELVPDLADALAGEASALSRTGVVMIQVDEPIFSTGAADLSLGAEGIRKIADAVSVPLCMHVCGPLVRIIDEILEMPVGILDFEGSCEPANIDIFSQKDLRDRYIGFGCVASASPAPDPVETILSRIQQGIEVFGPERLLLDPDCGLRMNAPDIAFTKLSRLCSAAGQARREFCS